MPNPRESGETIEIGRDYEYGPRYSEPIPARLSSTLRNDQWDYYDSIRGQRDYYNEYRPRQKGPDVYDRPRRPDSYQDNFYYDRWSRDLGPATHRRGAQNQAVSLRARERSPSPIRYDDGRITIADRSKRFASETAPQNEPAAIPKRRRNSEPIPGLFQTVFDVNHPQDTSVHLELPITDDYETELEEFCRLQRLGNFGKAEEYFRNHLEQHLSNPYVFVQYGQMLLEKGDYLSFERLDAEAVFGEEGSSRAPPRKEFIMAERTRSPPPRVRSWSPPREIRRERRARSRSPSPVINGRQDRHARFESDVRIVRRSRSPSFDRSRDWSYRYDRERDDERGRARSPDRTAQLQVTTADSDYDELELLRQNWRLMKSVCEIHTKGNYEDALTEAWYTIENFVFGAGIGSTEIQLAKLALQLCAHIERVAPERYSSGLDEAARSWIEWSTLFKELLIQDRIWDFKDLYVAILAAISDPEATPYFGTEENRRSLIDDWISEEGDESTNLALLDIILEPTQLRSVFPDETKSRVEAIIAHSPTAMKSRSFIRWILASAADALTGEMKGDDGLWLTYRNRINGFPGMVWHRKDCFLPGIYVPPNTQNPGWVAPEPSLAVKEPIQLALNLAKELKDYKSQVACLKLLIIQSSDPTELFQDLASFQKSMQGDKEGQLETLLSSYLVCQDRPSKERLLEQLQRTDDWCDDTFLRDGMLYWSRDFIERALKRSLQGPKSTAKLRNPPGFYIGKELPKEVEQFTWQNTGQLVFPHADVHQSYPQRRRNAVISSRPSNQTDGHQVIRPDQRPSAPYGRQSPWQSPHNPSYDGSFDRRERDELEGVRRERRIEMERLWEDETRERRDREMRLRLEDAEQRGRRQEELNKIQAEEMAKKSAEFEKLQHEYKTAKEKQDRETKARQDRDTRERLERAEASLRDQAERLRRAEDRSHQEWVSEKDRRSREKTRWGKSRSRRRNSVETASTASSDTYSSDSSRSSYYEDSDDDDDDTRPRNIKDNTRGGPIEKADHYDRDEIGNLQQNPCTELVLYEAQTPEAPEPFAAASSLPGSPTSPLQEQRDVDRRELTRRARKLSRTTTKSSGSKGSRSRARRQSKEIESKDNYTSGVQHPEDGDWQRSSLTEGPSQQINRTSSRGTKGSESKEKSIYRPHAPSRDTPNPDDITLFVKGSGILAIGNARLAIKDGEEITIQTNGSEKNSRGGNGNPSSEMDQQRAVATVEGRNLAKKQPAAHHPQSSSPPQGMSSPNVRPGWRLEESQLQEPLSSSGYRYSPNISSPIQHDQANSRSRGEVEEIVQKIVPITTDGTIRGAVPNSPPIGQALQREELEDLYESVRSIGVGERETSRQRQSRREKEERDDLEYHARREDRLSSRDRRSSLEVLSRRSTGMTEDEREGAEARSEPPRDHLKSAIEHTQPYTQENAVNLTQEPQVIYELDQTSPDATRRERQERPRPHISESQNRDELSSKQQNEKIASRPSQRHSRPSSIGMYGSPRPYIYDPTIGYDVWEDAKARRTPHSRVLVEPPLSSPNTPRVSARARSRPSSTQGLDDIRPLSRRTSSRLEYFSPPPPPASVDRLQSPTKRQSLIIDADGRPQPVRTKSESMRNRPGDAGSAPHIVVRRGVSADGRRPRADIEIPVPIPGPRSRPHSVFGPTTRHYSGPEDPAIERLPAENWERETEGVWRKKKGVSTVPEDPEEADGEEQSAPQPRKDEGESSKLQVSLDPEQGISRKSTVTDPEPEDE